MASSIFLHIFARESFVLAMWILAPFGEFPSGTKQAETEPSTLRGISSVGVFEYEESFRIRFPRRNIRDLAGLSFENAIATTRSTSYFK